MLGRQRARPARQRHDRRGQHTVTPEILAVNDLQLAGGTAWALLDDASSLRRFVEGKILCWAATTMASRWVYDRANDRSQAA